jgi:hypothetical protein
MKSLKYRGETTARKASRSHDPVMAGAGLSSRHLSESELQLAPPRVVKSIQGGRLPSGMVMSPQ